MLRFGTAGLRGPLREGSDGMNVTTVGRASAGIADWLRDRCLGGGRVIVGRDARHGSAEFATATAEIFAAAGFPVTLLPEPLPTPVTAFAVRELGAVAGVQITASHNPATDNGYKVYLDGGAQLLAPADTEIESRIEAVTEPIARTPVESSGADLVRRYLDRVSALPKLIGGPGERADIRIALTPLHGVGGETARAALAAAGFTDVHVVDEQFAPDPDFPTVAFPNPEEPGATDLLVALAERVGADIAIALDPDADRCAVGVPEADGKVRMLRGDETGVLLADCVLRTAPADALVATTIVSSRLLSRLAPARGARFAETLTGFKWLARAGDGLVYAYEEAIGHCADPAAVRDKDGISAAVLAADFVARLKAGGRTLLDELDDYAVEFGLHAGDQVSLRLPDQGAAAAVLDRLRSDPPAVIAGMPMQVTDLSAVRGRMRTDALIFEGESTRMVIRPSGTEPKLKCYLEVVRPVGVSSDLAAARTTAAQQLSELRAFCTTLEEQA
ncbi:phospho-sugar mutase [Nocardia sp. NPDC059180]|uniref:phospho-sugar mutase n=1 Tax=Nocardia sp. NPDC059180 TaxID=3346761 RepID=UPI003696E63C